MRAAARGWIGRRGRRDWGGAAHPRAESCDGVVRVVDASGYGMAALLVDALARAGEPAEAVPGLPRGGATVLVLPVQLDEPVPSTTTPLLQLQGRAYAGPGERPGWLVVVWAVRRAERMDFATPYNGDLAGGPRRGAHNAALLVIESAWARELHVHREDASAASRCVSDQVERLLRADTHQVIAGDRATRIAADARGADPGALHAVCVEALPGPPLTPLRWAGLDGVAATVLARRDAWPAPATAARRRGRPGR